MDMEPGQLAYETRFGLDPAKSAAGPWDGQTEDIKALWARVEAAIEERAVNTRWRLQIEAEEPRPLETVVLERHAPLGESLGYLRGAINNARPILEEFVESLKDAGPILGDHDVQVTASPSLISTIDKVLEAQAKGYTGEACDNCGTFAMVRTGKCSTCQNCAGTGGCG